MDLSASLLKSAAVALAVLLLSSCAGQRPPEGGPVDTVPPVIISTFPRQYATQYRGNRILLEFDKYVDHRSVEGSIFISPTVGPLEFDWSGREVEIRFSENLRPGRTYVVNVGTDVVDLHNRNRMAEAFTLAFSTGDSLDRGAIRGKVFPIKPTDSPSGVMIFAYNLKGLNPDTLNPCRTKPDYVTQTGEGGEIFLRFLALGPYRLLAVRDEYRNLVYDPETDEYGVPSKAVDLTLSDTIQSNIWMQLAKEDTTAPRLIKATAPDRRHLLVEFSQAVDTARVLPRFFQIADTADGRSLGVQSASALFPKLTSVLVVTQPQTAGRRYRVRVERLRDLGGIAISPIANSMTFSGSAATDTVGPAVLSVSIPDSSRDIDSQPDVQIDFSDAVRRGTAEQAITLQDTSRQQIPTSLRWLTDASVVLRPRERLVSKMWCRLSVELGKVRDLAGKSGRDTVRAWRFQTLDDELLSSIEGFVRDDSRTDAAGNIFLFAENIARKMRKTYQVKLERPGAFVLRDIIEGQYVLHAFRDRNRNQMYDAGRLYPFLNSERFTYYPDTLKVRARWPLDGVQLIFH
jgi:hypothetical protein